MENITVAFLLRSIKKGIVFRSVFTTIVGDNCERQKEKPLKHELEMVFYFVKSYRMELRVYGTV